MKKIPKGSVLLIMAIFTLAISAAAGELENQLADAIYDLEPDRVQALILMGANVNQVDANGRSVLGFALDQQAFSCGNDEACWDGFDRIINILKAAGARE